MCLAMPGKIVNFVNIEKQLALVDFLGIQREANVSLIENPSVHDYVIVHVGYAIQKIDLEDALESLKEWERFSIEERASLGY